MVSSNLRTTSKTISNKLNKLERRVTSKLNAFYKSKIRPNATLFPIETLRQKYDAEVRVIIRKAVQDSYLEGTDLVGQQIQEKAPDFQLFTSVTDVTNIQAITNDMANQFWTTTSKLVQRENEFVLAGDALVPKPSFDAKAAMIGLAALFTFEAFNKAVKSKLPTAIDVATPPVRPLGGALELDVGFSIFPLKGRVRFTTQHDTKVDQEICAPLDGQEWDANDPDIVVPPDDTHRFCRCHLLPIID
jgi:hypothetical protein